MHFSVRSKLIIAYATLLISLIVVAISGYFSFNEVIKGKRVVNLYTKVVLLSNLIYQNMADARKAQSRFLYENDLQYAELVLKKVVTLQHAALEFQTLASKTQDSFYIDSAYAIVESAIVYLETFQTLKEAMIRRGLSNQEGLLGKLHLIYQGLTNELPAETLLQIKLLELEYLRAASDKKRMVINNQMMSLLNNLMESNSVESLDLYYSTFRKLFFEDLNIKDLMPLMQLNAEMIELFVEDNVQEAKTGLEQQSRLTTILAGQQKMLLLLISTGAVLVGFFSLLILGSEPLMLSKLIQEQSATLEAIRDGLIGVNSKGEITVINQQAKKILGLKGHCLGKHIWAVLPESRLPQILKSRVPEYDQEQRVGSVTILTTRIPILRNQKVIGGIACFREKGELSRLAGQLTQVNAYIDALRANNHEFKNRLQTIQGMIQLNHINDVLEYIHQLQASHQQQISLYVDHIKVPAISAILLGKYNRAHELGISLFLDESSRLEKLPDHVEPNDFVSIIGNLIENAMDAVLESRKPQKKIWIIIKEYENLIYLSVRDNGLGISSEHAAQIFKRGFSTKMESPYGQGRAPEGQSKHMGFGLYITQNHVLSMSGGIQFKSEKGTTFEVSIPKKPTIKSM